MATYTPAQLYGNGSQGEDISTSLTFTFNNPSGSSYFTIETVQDRTGSFAGKQKNNFWELGTFKWEYGTSTI